MLMYTNAKANKVRKGLTQRGDVSIFFTSTMLMIIIMTALVVGMIAASTLKRTAGAEFPAQAFYAADSGIEYGRAQYFWDGWADLAELDIFDNSVCGDFSDGNVGYELSVGDDLGIGCPNILSDPDNADTLYFRSVGKSGGSVRRVELSF